MISGVKALKNIEVMADEKVDKELKTRIGKMFNDEKKDKKILERWIVDIAGDDEEFVPII